MISYLQFLQGQALKCKAQSTRTGTPVSILHGGMMVSCMYSRYVQQFLVFSGGPNTVDILILYPDPSVLNYMHSFWHVHYTACIVCMYIPYV